MMFGATQQQIDASLVAAQARISADTLFNQTGDINNQLVLTRDGEGLYTTQTRANQMLAQTTYSENKDRTTYLIVGGVVAGLVGLVWFFGRK